MYLLIISMIVLAPVLAFSLYKQNGKRQIFKLDSVQFIYLFVFMPVLYIWAKAYLFYVLNNDVGNVLSAKEGFIVDTTFSIVSFYLFSAVAIHTVTKTLAMQKDSDPDFDLFHMTEYFHLWWSHIFIYVGGMFALSFLSTINVFIPVGAQNNTLNLFLTLLGGAVAGIVAFLSIWTADPKQERRKFLRSMKICLMLFSMYHLLLFLLLDPRFSMSYSVFWFMFAVFISATVSGFSFVRSKKARRLHAHLSPKPNIDLFAPKDER